MSAAGHCLKVAQTLNWKGDCPFVSISLVDSLLGTSWYSEFKLIRQIKLRWQGKGQETIKFCLCTTSAALSQFGCWRTRNAGLVIMLLKNTYWKSSGWKLLITHLYQLKIELIMKFQIKSNCDLFPRSSLLFTVFFSQNTDRIRSLLILLVGMFSLIRVNMHHVFQMSAYPQSQSQSVRRGCLFRI